MSEGSSRFKSLNPVRLAPVRFTDLGSLGLDSAVAGLALGAEAAQSFTFKFKHSDILSHVLYGTYPLL